LAGDLDYRLECGWGMLRLSRTGLRRVRRARIEDCCDMETVLAGLIALALGVYLLVALVCPEKF
jgi:K+-transporting ATPase KdpF subunit